MASQYSPSPHGMYHSLDCSSHLADQGAELPEPETSVTLKAFRSGPVQFCLKVPLSPKTTLPARDQLSKPMMSQWETFHIPAMAFHMPKIKCIGSLQRRPYLSTQTYQFFSYMIGSSLSLFIQGYIRVHCSTSGLLDCSRDLLLFINSLIQSISPLTNSTSSLLVLPPGLQYSQVFYSSQ